MRLTIAVIFSVLFCVPLAAQQRDIPVLRPAISIGAGYFRENLDWSIAGNIQGESPNILSELKWNRQEGAMAEFGLNINIARRWFTEGLFSYARTYNGKVSDSDFSGDNREGRVFHAAFKTGKGFAYSTRLGAGYSFQLKKALRASLSLGIDQRSLKLFLSDEGTDLNSSYSPDWKGVYLKVMIMKPLNKACFFDIGLTYHQLQYKAEANWNLIDEFEHPVSFRHKAKGFGLNCEPSFKARVSARINWRLAAEAYLWQTGRGTDELFLTNGKTTITQLNEVNLKGLNITTGLNYKFKHR